MFSNQYNSSIGGHIYTDKDHPNHAFKYKGGTLFCDASSGYIFISNQVTLSSSETISSTLKFEKKALFNGIQFKAYQTDNGIYTSKEYRKNLSDKEQGLRLSGVGAHHQNSVARALLIHAALRWPEVSDKTLWPMALQHAVYLHNKTPKMDNGFSPEELWTGSKGNHESTLCNLHTRGCPAYVLDPSLQDGHKIPKWQPRSCSAQYLGVSPLHASTVGIVKILRTGRLSPQYHLVFDDFFETFHSHSMTPPPV